ncbi:hypothetical protein HW555_006540 [Spodoptera exigua]|uniref:Uncharacterized protein n=1 Tax=Spodoptera exigua TaxID=7107 RepID=A0A835GIS6_SPOEX|nr:hypothetical protein HW555_006540 [Spodoptera exigua]
MLICHMGKDHKAHNQPLIIKYCKHKASKQWPVEATRSMLNLAPLARRRTLDSLRKRTVRPRRSLGIERGPPIQLPQCRIRIPN